MPAPRSGRLAMLVPGLVCLGIAVAAGIQLYEGLMADFYWTPAELAPDLDGAAGEVEVWLDEDLLQRRLERGELVAADGTAIDPARVRVRLNGRDRVQRGQIALVAAAGGAGVAFLLSALLSGPRREKQEAP